jgi:uncharacterized iron-regulated protein
MTSYCCSTVDCVQAISAEINKTSVVDVSTVMTLDDIINRLALKKIIYIGEVHDQYAHHLTQLEIIKAMYDKNTRITIAMEMFDRDYQPIIDNYINDKISEREFLKDSRYFKTWGYDYNLYRNIILFAKTNNIPIIALNIEHCLVDKVSKTGLVSLTDAERDKVPNDIDLSDKEYSKRLKEIFNTHKRNQLFISFMEKDFDHNLRFSYFFEAQILWDEYMAESIYLYLKDNIDRQIIVIAGNGHISYGSGIPNRVKRRYDADYSIILNDEIVQKNIADFVLFPASVNIVESPKLMAVLVDEKSVVEQNGSVKVDRFPLESIAKKAGLKKGDYILSIDNTKINTIEDVQLFLFFCKSGDKIKIKLLRNKNHYKNILLTLK